MAEPRKISDGDSEYAEVYRAWERNGRPYQFDRVGDFGGAIYHCPDYRTKDRPDFYVHAEAGPTVFDEDKPGGPIQHGFAEKVAKSGYLQVRAIGPRHNARLKIRAIPLPRER
jgi:hypothetical protein